MSLKPSEGRTKVTREQVDQQIEEAETGTIKNGSEEDCDTTSGVDVNDFEVEKANGDVVPLQDLQDKKLSEWEARRYGAMAARLLRDIKIS